ncbi:MAG: heat-shock protein Hsp33 [Bdellovibrionales bacterium RIFCSPHIGHO2_01_FULL_40_29]|nr:MAG: heat-shock protein Hsp33 [Bdellovibrionales bacterium RIFCSPHIGHO2_01_FULL_40_29]OFZ32398.1 MAG: heat-shock protein Hsp33 [Bdellovibrionales bacterium RIFCSPHIGHO2_02_FULL_40_15]
MAKIERFVTNDLTVRAASLDATDVVAEMQRLHKAFPLATVGVGKAMIGALLLASQLKDQQKVGLLFRGNGALKSIYAEADFEGHVRAYTPNPEYQPPSYERGLTLAEALGHGTLSVSRHQPFQKQPFHGTVELVTSEIGDDIAHYLHQSHQIRSIVGLGIYLDQNGKVVKAGGVIIEVMPGVEDTIVELLEKNAAAQPHISKILRDGGTALDLVKPYFSGMEYTNLDHPYQAKYFCPCTKDRVIAALEVLGEADLQDMIDKKEQPEITCQMCGKPYHFTLDEVVTIREELRKNSMH